VEMQGEIGGNKKRDGLADRIGISPAARRVLFQMFFFAFFILTFAAISFAFLGKALIPIKDIACGNYVRENSRQCQDSFLTI
jgi:hypothetical protein